MLARATTETGETSETSDTTDTIDTIDTNLIRKMLNQHTDCLVV